MNTPQVHIVFNTAEDRRITDPIIRYAPNKLYYFTAYIKSTGQSDEHMDFYEKNIDILRKLFPQLDILHKQVDYTDYIEIIQELSKIIKIEREENPNCSIYLNIGSGSKITALASSEASMLWNCIPYYVHSEHYNPISTPRHEGDIIIKKPVIFPFKKPRKELIKVLRVIKELIDIRYLLKETVVKEKFIYKKDLLEPLIKKNLLTLEKKNLDPSSQKSSYYMKLNQRYLKPLANNQNYIKISKDKKNQKIYLTDAGWDVIKIFEFLL